MMFKLLYKFLDKMSDLGDHPELFVLMLVLQFCMCFLISVSLFVFTHECYSNKYETAYEKRLKSFTPIERYEFLERESS